MRAILFTLFIVVLVSAEDRAPRVEQPYPALVQCLFRNSIFGDFRSEKPRTSSLDQVRKWATQMGLPVDPAAEMAKRHERFRSAMLQLSEAKGWPADEVRYLDRYGNFSGRVVECRTEGRRYVVVVVCAALPVTSGPASLELVLISDSGRFLDAVTCEISNRLIELLGSSFVVQQKSSRAQAGVNFVFRLDMGGGYRLVGNFSHDIIHRGVQKQYYWGGDIDQQEPSIWDREGLCRVAIRHGKWEVLFPGADLKNEARTSLHDP